MEDLARRQGAFLFLRMALPRCSYQLIQLRLHFLSTFHGNPLPTTENELLDIAFQVQGAVLAAGQAQRLGIDPDGLDRARRAIRRVLATPKGAPDATTRPHRPRRRRA